MFLKWIYLFCILKLNLGCQVKFYDVHGRYYDISKAYDLGILLLDDCRDNCAKDNNCWAFMHNYITHLCALTNESVIFEHNSIEYFSARKQNCIKSSIIVATTTTTTTTTAATTTTDSESPLCTCKCEDSTVDIITKLNERIASLQLPKGTLSITRRKLTSADDQRPSAKVVGAVGVFVLVTFVSIIVFFDVLNFCCA